jgi:protoporphyrinogen/coproporphyrinogen III oxidase
MLRIGILGGGISGLSLAWWLHRHHDVIVFEKESRTGGFLKTECLNGFLFDRGPRTFRITPNHPFEHLIRELGLEGEVIEASSSARKRYLLQNGRLSPVSKMKLLPALFKEWWVPPCHEEESVAAFAMRRFNPVIAETLFDAMALGVYAGDMHALSIDAAFPKLKEWEKRYGSLTQGFIRQLHRLKETKMISFKQGSETLCQKLAHLLKDNIRYNAIINHVHVDSGGAQIVTNEGITSVDYVVSALPAHALSRYFPVLASSLSKLEMRSLQVVHCGFEAQVLQHRGFGYLVPTKEGEALLGTVFDSEIFPHHNTHLCETRLTMMIRENANALQVAQDALQRHLHIVENPALMQQWEARQAIPQLRLGHRPLIANLKEQIAHHYPRLLLTGNYLLGVSVADCIATSKDLSESLLHVCKRATS